MKSIAEQQQLFQSCRILFGTQLKVSGEFLEYLQVSGLKGAYRQRARETHPDAVLAASGLQGARGGSENFYRVQEAYEQLFSYLKNKESRPAPPPTDPFATGPKSSSKGPAARCAPQNPHCRATARPGPSARQAGWRPDYSPTENLYCGPLPQRQLLFGHFLYYSGLANWRTITRILAWQRCERPRLGELGHRFGMLRPADIASILREKAPLQSFGRTARDLGMLDEGQVRFLLHHQQRLQKKFGTILLEKNLVDQRELQDLLNQFERHNAQALRSLRGR